MKKEKVEKGSCGRIAKKCKRRAQKFYVIKLIGVNVESDRLALTWNSGFSH